MMDNKEHKYILELQKHCTIENLSPLVGMCFTVKIQSWSWGERVTDYDKLEITRVCCDLEITGEISISNPRIYCDYYDKGRKVFNAWTSISSIQEYIEETYKDE